MPGNAARAGKAGLSSGSPQLASTIGPTLRPRRSSVNACSRRSFSARPATGIRQACYNVTHWATGVGWGAAFGLASGSAQTRRAWHGLVFGTGVWAQSYTVLVPAKLYKPPWDYDAVTLWKDLSAHLVYGLATSTALRALAKPQASRGPVGRTELNSSVLQRA